MGIFKLHSPFKPSGDQPKAIEKLAANIQNGKTRQTLLGVTGSGKTFTMANVIEKLERPVLIMSPNKVLAAQLYSEFKQFFPENAVEYFISYYDYYQPEAYIPQTDSYIEKDAAINDHIEKLRLKATNSLLSRKDTIVVASVSSIYNIGSPESFQKMRIHLKTGELLTRTDFTTHLIKILYERNETEFAPGNFRVRGPFIDVFPPYSQNALRVRIEGRNIASIQEVHPITNDVVHEIDEVWLSPAKQFVSEDEKMEEALNSIKKECADRVKFFEDAGKLVEAQRIKQRTAYDMEMLEQTGFCPGIENYSRQLELRAPGSRPNCLFDYFRRYEDFIVFIDESHVAVPQIRGMHNGDRARKQMLIDFGFRLPSALDNRPLKFEEFEKLLPSAVFVSATPGPYELTVSGNNIVEQIIRPTGLVDPPVKVLPAEGQINDLLLRIQAKTAKRQRSLVLALTKKTAEDLSAFLLEKGVKARYLHSDIDSLERIEILKDFSRGVFDVLVGINLLREGIDIPQVGLVAILEADNEGFLRNQTTLIQIAGRAARNVEGEVLLYAQRQTPSMKYALNEMDRRRAIQQAYNKEHNIRPKTIEKAEVELKEFEQQSKSSGLSMIHTLSDVLPQAKNLPALIKQTEEQMLEAADNLDFELAAELRDRLFELKDMAVKSPKKRKQKR
ncbi:excinuclease ABC subunit UvrB [Candidatus Proelusimicrobium excrementi]|uniref:excinuclease ABC subunit UvrB n=1 Tax=Candidatus Proelusimicrobium excrementi TaxID=3416222 RepID=UPI003C9BCC54|nr:excinuclease ABC subunit UvrB [Elusimicrobiaceae bacterium]